MDRETEVKLLSQHPVVWLVAARLVRHVNETMVQSLTLDSGDPHPVFAAAALNYYRIRVGARGTDVKVAEWDDSVARAVLSVYAQILGARAVPES
jgi:hypothetical protein